MQFKDARALITGGSEGIGKAIGEAFVEKGARVGLMARRVEPLQATASSMGAFAMVGDVSREEDVQTAVKAFVEEFGGIDILINNAGIGYFSPLAEMDLAAFRKILDVNVTGAMLMARECVPHFLEQGRGEIVNISSTAGLKGFAQGSAYVASKFALKGMSECWRDELRRHDVRVTLVNPSEVQTGFGGRGQPTEINPKKLTGKEIAQAVVGALAIEERGFIPEFSVFATNPF